MERRVQRLRGRQIMSERLLEDNARNTRTGRSSKLLYYRREHARRDREVVRRTRRIAERFFESGIGGVIRVVAIDVIEALQEIRESLLIDTAAMLLDTVTRTRAKLLQPPSRFRNADDGNIQIAAPRPRMKRRKNLLVREVARSSKEGQRVGR